MKIYNDENIFVASQENLFKQLNGYIHIPIRYKDWGEEGIEIDSETMMEEFQRTVYGIETVVDFIQDKPFEDME